MIKVISIIVLVLFVTIAGLTHNAFVNTPDIPRESLLIWAMPLYWIVGGAILSNIIAFYNPRREHC